MNRSESKYFHTAVRMDEALIALLEEKPFVYITIKEICDKAQVNRSTFYLHYENTMDLLEETSRYLLDEFRSRFSVEESKIASRFAGCSPEEMNFMSDAYLRPYLEYVQEKRKVFLSVLMNGGALRFDAVYRRMFQYIFDPILERFHYPEKDKPFVMAFYLNGLFAVVREWLNGDCALSVEQMISIIQECVFGRNSTFIAHLQENT